MMKTYTRPDALASLGFVDGERAQEQAFLFRLHGCLPLYAVS